MRRGLILAGLVVALFGCDQASAPQPPRAYQGDAVAIVRFVAVAQVDAECRKIGARTAAGTRAGGCAQGNYAILPSPCDWGPHEPYRDLVCHELGHVNGWPADHPKS